MRLIDLFSIQFGQLGCLVKTGKNTIMFL